MAFAIQSPSPAESVAGHEPAGMRPQHAAVVGAEPVDDVVGHDRDPHRAVADGQVGDGGVQRCGRRDPLVAGSIFTTRPFSALATQTAPSAKTTGRRQRGRDAAAATLPFAGSTRTVSGPRATQTEPAP